ncbi:MAG: hypothetical protein ACSHX6_04855 [Akkermansiaceae bacterium]
MNSASFLLCIVFAAIGYVIHPMILPKLVDSGIVSESVLSDSYKKKGADKKTTDEEPELMGEDTEAEPVEPSAPDMEPEPEEEAPAPEPAPMPAPVPTPAPIPAPVPTPAPVTEQPAATGKLTDAEFAAVLKNSVSLGEVNEFKIDQVADWKRTGEEVVAGETYDVGLVTYNAKTIFGEEKLQAKALVKGGKVVKWLWPTTNTEMR